VKVGLFFDLRRPPDSAQSWARTYDFALEVCEEAERLGAASVWLSEHHLFDDGYLPQPLTFAAAVAARTRRIRIGTAVLLAALRHPVHLAEEAAIVDLISAGRLDLGLGAGYRLPEFELFGADIRRRFDRTDAMVGELREIWAAGRVTPPPMQDPIPLWLGYNGPAGARRAGQLGVGLLSTDPELAGPYLDGLRAGGHDPLTARMSGLVSAFVTDDPERDWPVVARHHSYQWDSYWSAGAAGTAEPAPPPVDVERVRRRGLSWRMGSLLYTTPEDAAARLRDRLAGVPVDTIFLWASIGAMPEDLTIRNVVTILTRLAPLLTTTD
jgi:alkanesulfonate monooxygenase SsuD/methylene tetrahydromethanopterin reductase-like flavin-dependent oxidoreductase (luciferase family)